MKHPACSNDTVQYTSPAHGGWGVVRLAMLLPESYQLFVCPFACGRHGAIGAIKQKLKDRLSYLYIRESDIVSGSYENLIPEAVEQLFAVLPKRPKVLMIFVSCLDDLLGTDHRALEAVLAKAYPDTLFTFCNMNPISQEGKNPPPVSIRRKMYAVLRPGQIQERSVNLIGNPVPVSPSSELYELLKLAGIEKVNHISDFQTFEEFQAMGRARLNLVTAAFGLKAAEDLKRNLGIDYLYLPVSYDLEEIKRQYGELFQKLGSDRKPEFGGYQKKAEEKIAKALAFWKRPIVIDHTAAAGIFEAADTLLNYGFSVEQILTPEPKGKEMLLAEEILKRHPETGLFHPQSHKVPALLGNRQDCLAIGYEAAYFTGSPYIADLVNDEGNFGFDGVGRLMDLIIRGLTEKQDLQKMINNYGLVI